MVRNAIQALAALGAPQAISALIEARVRHPSSLFLSTPLTPQTRLSFQDRSTVDRAVDALRRVSDSADLPAVGALKQQVEQLEARVRELEADKRAEKKQK